MHDFGKLVYLDLQKTGSTFVSQFLNETCSLPLVREWKHQGISRWSYRRDVFYFITVRHPISQYSSLFRYGLDRRGGLYERLAKHGKADLYRSPDSFNQWLRFMLDFENAWLLGEGFERTQKITNLGLLSYRYLMLSLVRPERTVFKAQKNIELIKYAKERSIVDFVIRNEGLNEGLMDLARTRKPEYFDQKKVEAFFQRDRKVNASTISEEQINEIDSDVRQLIEAKEKLLLDFYPSSRASSCEGQSPHFRTGVGDVKTVSRTPTISVCVPVHDGVKFLPRLFSCLADQSFRDFEVVLADDGSTDGSADEAERLLALYGLCGRVLRNPNQGSAQARDAACSSARAKIIATLDCDDWWDPNYLVDMEAALRAHSGTDLVYCDFLEEFPDGRIVRKSDVATWIELPRAARVGNVYGFARGEFFRMTLRGHVLFPSCTMYTKDLYQRAGGYSAVLSELPTSLDWCFALRAARVGSIAFLDRPLLRKYARYESVSNASFLRTAGSSIRVLKFFLRDPTLRHDERLIGRRYGALVSSWCAYESWATHKKQIQAMKWACTSLRFRLNWNAAKIATKALIPRTLIDWVRSRRTAAVG